MALITAWQMLRKGIVKAHRWAFEVIVRSQGNEVLNWISRHVTVNC
jgi:hypothetical protein